MAPASLSLSPEVFANDGSLTVSSAGVVVNQYTSLAVDVSAGSATLVVADAGSLASSAGPLGAGDLLMIMQMQGATIDTSDSPTYGNVLSLGGAGLYELFGVAAVSGNTITVADACAGLKNGYSHAGLTQVIRVPRFHDLTVDSGGSIVPAVWNGETGGIVAIEVQATATINGALDAGRAGFRGGVLHNQTDPPTDDIQTYRSANTPDGGEKGESIAGFEATYDLHGGRNDRGAPANGGGGGNSHNCGGGGGANGNNGQTWTGQGIMDPTDVGVLAWSLDTADIANGGQLTSSGGGGRGGYSFSFANQDPRTVAPGTASWTGNFRREHGGWGGRPMANDPLTRLFVGGGGGAGDENNAAGGAGGAGGGLVLLMADHVTGAGSILANGQDGFSTVPAGNDGPGGAGAGGTIVVLANTLGGIAIHADGGAGGHQSITTDEAEGPGGGGGGGYIALSGGTVATSALGGAGGTTDSSAIVLFPSNGATRGAPGQPLEPATAIPICRTDDLSVTKTDGTDSVAPGQQVVYTIVVTNDGDPAGASGVQVTDTLPPSLANASWTCTASAGSSCAAASGTGSIDTTVDLDFDGTATFVLTATVVAGATGTVVNSVSVAPPGGTQNGSPATSTSTDTDTVTTVVVPGGFEVAGSGCSIGAVSLRDTGLAALVSMMFGLLVVLGRRVRAKPD